MIPVRIKNNLYRFKGFWLFKKWLNRPVFLFWANMFHGHYTMDNTKNYIRILKPTVVPFLGSVLYSAFIIFILELYNKYFPMNSQFFDKASTDSLLTAVASLMGVFLGLYFAALSGIASNFLIRATQDVRRFFFSAPMGLQYVRTIAITGIVSVFYLFLKSFGHTIHPVGLAFLSLLAAYIIIRFWSIGSSVFNSMEPGSSFPFVRKDIEDSIKDIAPPGFQWQMPLLQNHRRRLVVTDLDLLANLVDFGIKELELPDEQLLTAIAHSRLILLKYSESKGKIPRKSLWYETKSQFENWAFTDSTRISLAINTGTSIQPKSIQDFFWFENRVFDIIVKVLNELGKKNKILSVFQGYEYFIDVAEEYGKNLEEENVKILLQKLEGVFSNTHLEKTDEGQVAHKEQLALLETQGRLAIAALLGLIRHINKYPCEKISSKISGISWNSKKKETIYLTGLPSSMLPRLEEIEANLENEKVIEGKIQSPRWYIKTLCMQQYLYSLEKYFIYIKSLHSDYFQQKFDKLLVEEQYSLAVHFLQRWLEFSNKYQNLIGYLKKQVECCKKFHWVKDLPFPDFDFSQEEKIASDREREVTDKMIKLLPKLKSVVTEKELPDYFGQVLTLGLQACYEACMDNNAERFKNIFPIIFDASLVSHDKIRKEVQNWSQDDSKIIYSTEPLANLFEISGFALLYAELYQNNELWNITKKTWDAYLEIVDAKAAIQFMIAIVGYRNSLFVLMPQAILRTNWQMNFNRKMKEAGLPVFPEDRYGRKGKISHQSALIRVIAKWGGLSVFSAQEVFFTIYLSNRPEAKDLAFPDKHELKEEVEKEEKGNIEEEYE